MTAPSLERTLEDYLAYLQVERGLAPATIRAYRADLTDFGRALRDDGAWARSPDPVVRYLAERTSRGRRGETVTQSFCKRERAATMLPGRSCQLMD